MDFFSFQEPTCVKAIIVKAESLYNICNFEHALALFTKGKKLAPDCDHLEAGVLKCKKTILNKIQDDDVFFFAGSKHFIDYLRKQGGNSVDVFLNDGFKEKKWKKSLTLVSLNTKKGNGGKKNKVNEPCSKKVPEKDQKRTKTQDRMKVDKDYLRNLEKKMAPLSGTRVDVTRFDQHLKFMLNSQTAFREKVAKTVKQTMEFFETREEFWNQIG